MTTILHVRVLGLPEVQKAYTRLMSGLSTQGGLGRAIHYLASEAQKYAASMTHVVTGTLQSSHQVEQIGLAQYSISISPASINPLGARPAVYGPVEHSRGGSHAFYERTVYSGGPELAGRAIEYLIRELP